MKKTSPAINVPSSTTSHFFTHSSMLSVFKSVNVVILTLGLIANILTLADFTLCQILLPEVGEAGQQKLLNATVLLIGIGGLGSPSAMYLAAALIAGLVFFIAFKH
jgi:hypothetical protein